MEEKQWEPWVGEVLRLERDPTNQEDINAVAIINASGIVGHVPFNLAPIMSAFLRRPINKRMAEVTGNRVNRGAGYGLEIPCKYHFFGSYYRKTKNYSGTNSILMDCCSFHCAIVIE